MDTGTETRRARLFRNGRSQAVRIPKEFEFEGEEVELRKAADGSLVITPTVFPLSWRETLAAMEPLGPEDRFPEIGDYPPEPVELLDEETD